jgi:hypothetical protein
MKWRANVAKWVDCALKARMKRQILDSEDAALFAIATSEKILKNDANSRMWFKRQFLAL